MDIFSYRKIERDISSDQISEILKEYESIFAIKQDPTLSSEDKASRVATHVGSVVSTLYTTGFLTIVYDAAVKISYNYADHTQYPEFSDFKSACDATVAAQYLTNIKALLFSPTFFDKLSDFGKPKGERQRNPYWYETHLMGLRPATDDKGILDRYNSSIKEIFRVQLRIMATGLIEQELGVKRPRHYSVGDDVSLDKAIPGTEGLTVADTMAEEVAPELDSDLIDSLKEGHPPISEYISSLLQEAAENVKGKDYMSIKETALQFIDELGSLQPEVQEYLEDHKAALVDDVTKGLFTSILSKR